METETCQSIKPIWTRLLEQEIAHLHKAKQLLEQNEGTAYQQVVGKGDFPAPLKLESNIDYVRDVLASTVEYTAVRESYCNVKELKPGVDFFLYQNRVNSDVAAVPSHAVIMDAIKQFGQDYRFETKQNPIEALRDRTHDNTTVGRGEAAQHS